MVGGTINKVNCPSFSVSVTTTAAYTQYTKIQRTQQLADLFGTTTQTPQTYTQAAKIEYAAVNKISTGESATAIWDSKVLNIFDGSLKHMSSNCVMG